MIKRVSVNLSAIGFHWSDRVSLYLKVVQAPEIVQGDKRKVDILDIAIYILDRGVRNSNVL